MGLYDSILKPTLFQFDPERAHETAMGLLKRGILKTKCFTHPALRQTVFGTTFNNPLGLAAGFDKNGIALDHWHQLGFGFVEVGTITAKPQPGNEKPRMFRLPKDEAIINRLGFNNDGARAIAMRIAESMPQIPLGINLGKSKVTPIEDAASDYAASFRLVHRYGNYFVINVSSPNTPGLRELQVRSHLKGIIEEMKAIDAERPILVKVAPDMDFPALDEIIGLIHETGLAGIVATNTTIGRPGLLTKIDESGGLSGKPLRNLATQFIRHLYKSCDKNMILIGVGGIMNGDDLYDRLASGAHLCQTYTGWVYGGPQMVPTALERVVELMKERGQTSLAEVRGSALN